MRQTGQAILEMTLFLAVIVWLLSSGLSLINSTLSKRQQLLDQQRLELWQPQLVDAGNANYSYARAIKPIFRIFNQLPNLELPLANLYTVAAEDKLIRMTKLTNSWSAVSVGALVTEPRKLTVVPVLEKLGFDTLLQTLGRLPMSRELARGSFQFGPLNADATPHEVMCQPQESACVD